MEFSLDIAKQLIESSDSFPVNFDDAWKWLEYSQKAHAKTSLLKCGFIEGVDFNLSREREVRLEGERTVTREVELIKLTTECFKQWGMMCGTDKGKQIRLYFLECEKQLKQNSNINSLLLELLQQQQRQSQQLEELQKRTLKLDQVEEEKAQLIEENNTLFSELETRNIVGQLNQGCQNVIDKEVVGRPQCLCTAFDYLASLGQDTSNHILLAKRAATFYRIGKKKQPYKDAATGRLLFEISYLEEAYESLTNEGTI